MTEHFRVRAARHDDVPGIERLIERSVRQLSVVYYDGMQIESALTFMFGPAGWAAYAVVRQAIARPNGRSSQAVRSG